jgi:hypothetical protein
MKSLLRAIGLLILLVSPAFADNLSGVVILTADANDNIGVVGVQFRLDGVNFSGEVHTDPYSVSWDTTNVSDGPHTISVIARDAAGNLAYSSTDLIVDNSAPTVSFIAPIVGAVVSGKAVSISAQASDDTGLAEIQFQLDGEILTTKVRTNVAAFANGGKVSSSSTIGDNYAEIAVIDGDRKGVHWGNGGGWNDATPGAFPDFVQIAFNGVKTINEVDVFTLQDDFDHPVDPSMDLEFTRYGITSFQVQYWDGGTWVLIPGADVTNNNRVWRQISFTPITTSQIRVYITGAIDMWSRVIEVEVYSDVNAPDIIQSPASIVWDSTTVSNGVHSMVALARDTAGNVKTAQRTIHVDNVSPGIALSTGFENGDLAPWKPFGTASSSVSHSIARTGDSSVSESDGSGGVFMDLSGLIPGVLYQVTAFAHADPGTTNQARLEVQDATGNNTVVDGPRTPGSGWEAFTVSFLTLGTGQVRIRLWSGGGAGNIYWDDVWALDVSGFENAAAWPQFGGVKTAISNAEGRTGNYSLVESGTTQGGVFLDVSGLTPGALYQVTAFAHGDPGTTSQALLLVHDTTGTGSIVDGWRTPGSGWDSFSVTFIATGTARMRILLFSSGGSGSIYWDDVHVGDASGFENGTSSRWSSFGGVNASVIEFGARSGMSSLTETGGSSGGVFQEISGLNPGGLYQVIAFAYVDPGTDNKGALRVMDINGAGVVVDGFRSPRAAWDPFTVTFLATATGRMRIYLLSSGDPGSIDWDDVRVVDLSSFETGVTSTWPQFGGINISISMSAARSGATSLAENGSSPGGAFQDISGLTAGALYQITAFAHVEPDATSQALLLVHDCTGRNSVVDGWRSPVSGFESFTVAFTTTNSGCMRVILFSSGGTGTVYWDDIRVTDASSFENALISPWPTFGGVALSIANLARTGTLSLSETGSTMGGAFLDLTGLTPGGSYQITAYALADPGATSQALLLVHDSTGTNSVVDAFRTPSSNVWTAYSVTFVATSNGRMRIHLISSGGVGTVYWDDVTVK